MSTLPQVYALVRYGVLPLLGWWMVCRRGGGSDFSLCLRDAQSVPVQWCK